ncbi:MAG: dependent oxidoreductase [Moraxellaceae bacterium]|nr:dependent oxidoreductase [Moraxellaceae bacterium]
MDRQPMGKATSLWLDTAPEVMFPMQSEPVEVDVAVIGGGISGITAASELKAAGRSVALLDAGRLLQGVTGQTTAKVTSQHTLIYTHLVQHFGEDKARAYADANQAAIEHIAQQAQARGIDCDLQRTEAWTWAETDEEVAQLHREAEAALRCGLPARFSETCCPWRRRSPATAAMSSRTPARSRWSRASPARCTRGAAPSAHATSSSPRTIPFPTTRSMLCACGPTVITC